MTEWMKYFKTAGGIRLLRQYLKNRTLGIAINQFLILGRSRKALEILRLSVELKLLRRLKKKENKRIREFGDAIKKEHLPRNHSKNIWICWWQGIENAPELVRVCYASVCTNFKDWDIHVITLENYMQYVEFPAYIIEKWNRGEISHTHMSDLLRLELLIRHGGLWLDATILVTSENVPRSILSNDLFFFQTLKPGADGHTILCSSWLLYAISNQPILRLTRDLLYDYWSRNTSLADYFLLHYYFTIACDFFEEDYKKVPQFSNEAPHILLLSLFDKFNPVYWEDLQRITCFHKLSYKLDPIKIELSEDSYYHKIISKYGTEIS